MSDLYDKEVDTLLKMGGQKALENQYKNISRRLDAISSENIHLKQVKIGFEDKIANLEEKIGYYKDSLLRTDKNCDKLYHENKELKQRISELESKETSELPFDPLETANYLINATYERETGSLERGLKGLPEKVNSDRYTIDGLEQIAEHLLVYCKHNKESEE